MIIDSSVLVDIDRGSEKYTKIPSGRHSISAATYAELSIGENLSSERNESLRKIQENLDVLPIDKKVAAKVGEIIAKLKRRGERIGVNDAYIAATALVHDKSVLTGNSKHFQRIEDLEVVDWEKL